jgi:hypothetical protein
LAAKLRKAGIEYRMIDNAFIHIGDWEVAQTLGVAYQWNRPS